MEKRKVEKIDNAAKNVREEEPMDIVDVLLDENNKEPIVLEDAKGKRYSFEQIAVIPYNEKLYCVLKPIDQIEGVNDDEAIVFVVHEEEGKEPALMVETDEEVAMQVFEEYYNLLDEAAGESDGGKSQKASKSTKTSATKTGAKKTTTTKSASKTTTAKKSSGSKSGK